jgi:hypothetical protein
MDRASLLRGIGVSVYLVILFALLVVFLVRQRVPRHAIFEIVEISLFVFVSFLFLSIKIADRVVLNGGDSLVNYLIPVIPVAIFAIWMSRRMRNK